MRPIAIDISPNAGWREFFYSTSWLLRPWRWRDFTVTYKLEKTFQEFFQFQEVMSVDSGRSALYEALQAMGVGEGDEVAIQAFTCSVVPVAILWTGAKPVYVDVDESLNMDPRDLEKKLSENTKAVIVQHTFGYPAQMKEILNICDIRENLYLIEDCAHSLGAEYKNQRVGTFGDVAFFSFGRDKVISSVFGGLLGINNRSLAGWLKKRKSVLPSLPVKQTAQGLWHPVIFQLILPLYNLLGIGRVLAWLNQRLGLISRVISASEKRLSRPHYMTTRLSGPLAALALFQFRRLRTFNEHRRRIAQYYFENLRGRQNLELPPKPRVGDRPVYLRFPVFLEEPDALVQRLSKKGVYLGNWYRPVIAPNYIGLKRLGYKKGMAPRAEKFSSKVINLPTYFHLSSDQAQRVVQFVCCV